MWVCVGGTCWGTMDQECHMMMTDVRERGAFEMNLGNEKEKTILEITCSPLGNSSKIVLDLSSTRIMKSLTFDPV